MAVYLHALIPSVTIETGVNDTFSATDAGGPVTITIPAGTYYIVGNNSATCLLYQIETAMNASALSRTYSVTLTMIAAASSDDRSFRVNMSASGSWTLTWGTFDGTDLGYQADLTTPDVLDTYYAQQNPKGMWRNDDVTRSVDTVSRGFGNQIQTVGGPIYTHDRSGQGFEDLIIQFAFIPEAFAEPLEQTTNAKAKTLRRAWRTWRDGRPVRIYKLELSHTGVVQSLSLGVLVGTYCLAGDHIEGIKVERLAPGVPYYDAEPLLWLAWSDHD